MKTNKAERVSSFIGKFVIVFILVMVIRNSSVQQDLINNATKTLQHQVDSLYAQDHSKPHQVAWSPIAEKNKHPEYLQFEMLVCGKVSSMDISVTIAFSEKGSTSYIIVPSKDVDFVGRGDISPDAISNTMFSIKRSVLIEKGKQIGIDFSTTKFQIAKVNGFLMTNLGKQQVDPNPEPPLNY